ncbi:MAG: MFS transporter [Gemmatimonadales bacterium]|nr:MFS transporter [Gemmatimonadales bacterium]NIN12155.1 MFS transporter [Gemmatimonadales bacterium]NIN50576.1 MFS transporter [Gemmatimonadales bacterium]NIP08040.1 MFS transporter [Gemmatimonadales bacterium]NIR00622.1 MFS transporter [Gemmatimonadales bacterium]
MTASAAPRRVSVYPILAVNFVGALGFSIVLPFLVFLVTRLGGNALVYGVMGATYSFFQLIGAPILGRWSDRHGRRKILLLSQLGTLVSWVIFLGALFLPVSALWQVDSRLVGTFTVTVPLMILFFARALDGITGGNVSVANAYLADITADTERSAAFGKMAVASNLGFIVGPAIAGALGATAWGETPPVLAAAMISGVATLVIVFGLPETRCCVLRTSPEQTTVRKVLGQEQRDCYELKAAKKLSAQEIFRLPSLPRLMTLYFLVYLAFNFFYISFPIHAVTRLDWSLTDTGVFFAAMGLMMVIVQGPVLGRVSRVWSDRVLVVGGSVTLAASFVFFTSADTLAIYGGTALLALGNGLMWPSLLAIISRAAGEDAQGAVQGFAGSAAAVASIVGLVVGGVLYGVLTARIFLLSAAITFLVFLMTLALPAPATQRDSDES